MGKCKVIKLQPPIICASAFRIPIVLRQKQINGITLPNSVDFTISYPSDISAFALVKTKRGTEIFDGTNTKTAVTHEFTVRYIPNLGLGVGDIINMYERNFSILEVENLDELNKFIVFTAIELGNDTIPANEF